MRSGGQAHRSLSGYAFVLGMTFDEADCQIHGNTNGAGMTRTIGPIRGERTMRNATVPVRRTVRIDLTLTPKERTAISVRAAQVGMPVARYLREAGLALPLATLVVDDRRVEGLVAERAWTVGELRKIIASLPADGLLLDDELLDLCQALGRLVARLAPSGSP